MDVPYPASNHVSHPVPNPLAGSEKATACDRPLQVAHGHMPASPSQLGKLSGYSYLRELMLT